MAISISNYVDIKSAVGGASQAQNRALIARFFSSSLLIPTQQPLEFTTLQAVSDFFGASSEEYKRAVVYFGYVSKSATSPNRISFASYQPSAIAARIYGGKSPAALASLQAVTSGQLVLNIGASSFTMASINLSVAADLAGVASIIQTAIRTGPTSAYTGATVTWNATANRFEFVAGATGANVISTGLTASGVQLLPLLQWDASATFVYGVGAQEPVDAVIAATAASNNFGSFAFISGITQSQIAAVAAWNDAQNVSYLYSVAITPNIASTMYNLLKDVSGVALTLDPAVTGQYPEMLPMNAAAATDYSRRNATLNYMFLQDNLTASVTTDALAATYDNLRINYYGQTQQAGISFYQRGVMMGLATDPTSINVYVNEMWFKDAVTVAIMNLLLALPRVPANTTGQGQLMLACQAVIEQARFNGVISIGKSITATQQAFITLITGDDTAWREVQSQGYWFNIKIVLVGTEYQAQYTLVYSKDDAIRKVTGSNILI